MVIILIHTYIYFWMAYVSSSFVALLWSASRLNDTTTNTSLDRCMHFCVCPETPAIATTWSRTKKEDAVPPYPRKNLPRWIFQHESRYAWPSSWRSNDLAHQPGMEDRQRSAIQRAHLDSDRDPRLLREQRYQQSFGISNRPSPEHWSCPIPRPLDLPIVASRFDVILSRVFLSLPRRALTRNSRAYASPWGYSGDEEDSGGIFRSIGPTEWCRFVAVHTFRTRRAAEATAPPFVPRDDRRWFVAGLGREQFPDFYVRGPEDAAPGDLGPRRS